MGKKVIIACDFNSKEKLESFLNKMEGVDKNIYCKVGMELFNAGALQGFNPVEIIKSRGHKVFLDLKLKDIPNTAGLTAKVLAIAGADMIDVHADGGYKMMAEVVKAIDDVIKENSSSVEIKRPILLGVTVLTSMNEEELKNEIKVSSTSLDQVINLAKLCKKSGFDGVVCSPEEIMAVKEACGDDFITVTPGIRFSDSKKDDQTRIATPACANILGSDYIVVGRPITQAENPIEAYNKCKQSFTEKVVDSFEKENAKAYIENLKDKYNKDFNMEAAKAILEAGCITYNFEVPYLLKSGIGSPIYCDNRELYGSPIQREIIIDALADLVKKEFPDAEILIGTPLSGIPYAALVADKLKMPMGFVRKEPKNHGKGKKIEGKIIPGIKAVAIEDLVSSGESVEDVVNTLREAGANVLGIASIVRNNTVALRKGFIDLDVKYAYVTDMNLIVKEALGKGICTEEEYNRFLQYAFDSKDESWMSEIARENIRQKRLAREKY
jgi:orotidine-5'-phosphate decarboxylase